MKPLTGKVALVTGGSRGMGAAIAKALGMRGASVALTYRASSEAAEREVAELRSFGVDAMAIQADHHDDESTIGAAATVISRFGRMDILVNSAGVFPYGPVEQITLAEIDRVFAIHARAPLRLVQAVLPAMSGGGRIISIGSSLATHVPGPNCSLYSMSKASLVGLTKALARELGPRGITVNLLNPGSVDTDMNPADGLHAAAEKGLIPLGRYGRAGEIGEVVAFLVGPSGDFINGAILSVDGGATA